MNYLVINPNGKTKMGQAEKKIDVIPVNKINVPEDFISQYVGASATMVEIGDYRLWINNLENTSETEPEKTIFNLLLNESIFAIGNVVVTSNRLVSNKVFAGVDEMDEARFVNAFKKTTQILVDDARLGEVTVDRIFDSLLTNQMNKYSHFNSELEKSIELHEPKKEVLDDISETEDIDYVAPEIFSPAVEGHEIVYTREQVKQMEQDYLKNL